MDNFNLITNMSKFTLFLHRYIYRNRSNIDILKDCISSQFEDDNLVSSISFANASSRFELKIRKSGSKKEKNIDIQNVLYNKVLNAFCMFFSNENIINDMRKYIDDIDDAFEHQIINSIFNEIIYPMNDSRSIELLYHMTFVDNMVFINI